MSVWCSTIWMEKAPAIDIIFLLLIHSNGTVCSRCWEKKLHLKTWSTWATTVVCPQCCVQHKETPKPSINIFLSLFMRSERGCNVTTGCTSCSLRVFTPFMVFWSLTDISGSRFNVYFIFGGLHLVYDSNETHKFLMNNTTASCIYAGCAWQSVVQWTRSTWFTCEVNFLMLICG